MLMLQLYCTMYSSVFFFFLSVLHTHYILAWVGCSCFRWLIVLCLLHYNYTHTHIYTACYIIISKAGQRSLKSSIIFQYTFIHINTYHNICMHAQMQVYIKILTANFSFFRHSSCNVYMYCIWNFMNTCAARYCLGQWATLYPSAMEGAARSTAPPPNLEVTPLIEPLKETSCVGHFKLAQRLRHLHESSPVPERKGTSQIVHISTNNDIWARACQKTQ